MTTEEKFHAAINVIRSLPKSGSYQPSHDLMLRFYSYFKQATEGPCTKPKPAFWDMVNRAKWDAWKKLGDMTSEKAMESYVAELHKIVETMSYTDNVAAFFDTVDSDVPVNKEDLYLVAGDVLRKSSSSPSTPTGTQDRRTEDTHNGHAMDSEDEYIDTSEESDLPVRQLAPLHIPNGHAPLPTGLSYDSRGLDTNNKVLDDLRRTVNCLEKDVALLKERVTTFEKKRNKLERSFMWQQPSWWPLKDISPALIMALVVWPVVANRLVAAVRRKR